MTLFTRRDALHLGAGALAGTTMLGERQPAGADRGQGRRAAQVRDRGGRHPARAAAVQVRPGRRDAVPREHARSSPSSTGVEVTVTSESWEDLRPEDRDRGRDRQRPRHRLRLVRRPAQVRGAVRRPHRPRRPISATSTAAGGRSSRSTARARRPANGSRCRSAARATASSTASPGSTRPATRPCPTDLDGFLDMARKLKANGHPIGFALGNATGDANCLVPLADVDPWRRRWPTRTTRSSSTARRRSRR